jgi:hypothetical protein
MYSVQLPQALERKLYEKLKGDVFDIGFKVKMMVDEEEEKMDLQCCAALKKNEDVFLIDHAWTFKQRDADKTLRSNDKLLERMLNIIKYSEEKQDLPTNPYDKPRPTFMEYIGTLTEETTDYDLDGYGIQKLSTIPFSKKAV